MRVTHTGRHAKAFDGAMARGNEQAIGDCIGRFHRLTFAAILPLVACWSLRISFTTKPYCMRTRQAAAGMA
jgi:hypothetical protein